MRIIEEFQLEQFPGIVFTLNTPQGSKAKSNKIGYSVREKATGKVIAAPSRHLLEDTAEFAKKFAIDRLKTITMEKLTAFLAD